ncbi:unnamed protein product, partial [marine sediment metagenome]
MCASSGFIGYFLGSIVLTPKSTPFLARPVITYLIGCGFFASI